MSPSRELYELQKKEIQAKTYHDSLLRIKKELETHPAMSSAKSKANEIQHQLHRLEVGQKDLELVVSALESKIKDIDRKLYSGTTSNSKELISFQNDSNMLNRQKRQEEEKLLDIMGKVEETEGRYKEAITHFQNIETEWTLEEKRLTDESVNLGQLVTVLELETGDLISKMVDHELKLFRTLQSSKGNAVTKAQQGICKGCGLTLPSGEIQKIRMSTALIRCPSCRRILIAG